MKLFIACVLMVAVAACIGLTGARILFFGYVNAIPSSLQQKSCPGGASGNHTDICTPVSCNDNFSSHCPPQVQISKHCKERFCKPPIQSHLKFVVSVLHVYTKDIVVEITIDGHHNSAIAHANPPSTKGVAKFVIIDFKNIPGTHIGDEYEVCSWVKDNPDGNEWIGPAKITNLVVQHATVDTNDYED